MPPTTATETVRRTAGRAVVRPRPVADPGLRSFLFHHAGGSHLFYRGWPELFPSDWDVCPLDSPGRGRLHDLPASTGISELVAFLRDDLSPWLDRPFAFFGHSMGALVAYELTHRLVSEGNPGPVWLGLSGLEAPGVSGRVDAPAEPTGTELRERLAAVGATPCRILDDDELWRLFEPILRHDFTMMGRWRTQSNAPPLPTPLSVFSGDADGIVDAARLDRWAHRSQRFIGPHLYPGDHFYLLGHRAELARQMVVDVGVGRRWSPAADHDEKGFR